MIDSTSLDEMAHQEKKGINPKRDDSPSSPTTPHMASYHYMTPLSLKTTRPTTLRCGMLSPPSLPLISTLDMHPLHLSNAHFLGIVTHFAIKASRPLHS
jgi:hypothetical protein